MKYLSLLIVAGTLAVSCKKEQSVTQTGQYTEDSVTIPETNEPALPSTLKTTTQTAVAELVNAKQNDTVYVTNFFATWCGPCMREIPHFKKKMAELQGKPVKFTFVSLDQKTDWDVAVKNFAEEQQLQNNVVLLDPNLPQDFFSKNFKTWKGETIPFTVIRKGDKVKENEGAMSEEQLSAVLAEFN